MTAVNGPASLLDALPVAAARTALLSCCGSERWADGMLAARPFASDEALLETADSVWWGLDASDWREAFGTHPRIGERSQSGAHSPETARSAAWSAGEQAGAADADEGTLRALAAGNRDYENRFGHVFLICATGKTAREMLEELRRRMTNDPETELRTAAREQAAITRLRLEKLTLP